MSKESKALILFSGGLDSTVLLAKAIERDYTSICVSFDYGQKHLRELDAAAIIADIYKAQLMVISIRLPTLATSSLVGDAPILKGRTAEQINEGGIPSTYVPGRNTLFLSYALSIAESLGAIEVHHGANALDHNSYPDCRPEYFAAFRQLADTAFSNIQICTPLLYLNKRQIYDEARRLNAPVEKTWSCYCPIGDMPCETCDACSQRKEMISS